MQRERKRRFGVNAIISINKKTRKKFFCLQHLSTSTEWTGQVRGGYSAISDGVCMRKSWIPWLVIARRFFRTTGSFLLTTVLSVWKKSRAWVFEWVLSLTGQQTHSRRMMSPSLLFVHCCFCADLMAVLSPMALMTSPRIDLCKYLDGRTTITNC